MQLVQGWSRLARPKLALAVIKWRGYMLDESFQQSHRLQFPTHQFNWMQHANIAIVFDGTADMHLTLIWDTFRIVKLIEIHDYWCDISFTNNVKFVYFFSLVVSSIAWKDCARDQTFQYNLNLNSLAMVLWQELITWSIKYTNPVFFRHRSMRGWLARTLFSTLPVDQGRHKDRY